MIRFDPVEWKILGSSIVAAWTLPSETIWDISIKFFTPIAAGVFWVFFKPVVERWKRKNEK